MKIDLKNTTTRTLVFIGIWIFFWTFLCLPLLNNWISNSNDITKIPLYYIITQGLFFGSIYLTIYLITKRLDYSNFSLGAMLMATALFVVLSSPQCISAPSSLPQIIENVPVIGNYIHNGHAGAIAGKLLITDDNSMCLSANDTLISWVFNHFLGIQYNTNGMYYLVYFLGTLIMFMIGAFIIGETELYRKLSKIF